MMQHSDGLTSDVERINGQYMYSTSGKRYAPLKQFLNEASNKSGVKLQKSPERGFEQVSSQQQQAQQAMPKKILKKATSFAKAE